LSLARVLVAIANAPPPDEAKDDVERQCARARIEIERWLAVALLLFCGYSLYAAVHGAVVTGEVPSEAAEAAAKAIPRAFAERSWPLLVLLAFFALNVILVQALPMLLWKARERWLAGDPPDWTRRPPPWGLPLFLLAFVGVMLIGGALKIAAPSPKVVVEQPAPRELPLRAGAVAFGPPSAPGPGGVVAVEHATSVRARVEIHSGKILLTPEPGVPSAPTVFVDAAPVTSALRLKHGDRIKIDEVVARIDDPAPALSARGMLLQLLAQALGVLVVLVLVKARGASLAELGLTLRGAPLEAARGFAIVLAALPWVYALLITNAVALKVLGVPLESHPMSQEVLTADLPAVIAIFVAATVGAPLLEELLFRGLLFRSLRRPLGVASALVLSGIFFGALHPLANVVPVGFLGIVLAGIFATSRQRSLVASIAGHATFNGSQLLLALVVRQLIYG
jgi:membrane protease YdiL (CAAX protease family)